MNHYFTNYNPDWLQEFQTEKETIEQVFEKYGIRDFRIEHIGSTAIPGLAAKPIIDIGVLVNSIEDVDYFAPIIRDIGYTYYPELSSKERIFCRKGFPVTHHLSFSSQNFSFWNRQILFREYLIKHPEYITEYANLKRSNLENTPQEELFDLSLSEQYNSGKTEFIRKILDLAKDEEN